MKNAKGMSSLVCAGLLLSWLLAASAAHTNSRNGVRKQPAEVADTQSLRVALDLEDGSHIIGTPAVESVPITMAYATIDIPLSQIVSIRIANETALCSLTNGDKLTCRLGVDSLSLETVFGNVRVDVADISRLTILASRLDAGLILHYTFDNDEDGKIVDQSGNGNHGAIKNNPLYVGGVIGKALKVRGNSSVFSSAGDHVVLPAIDLAAMSGFTISLWVSNAVVNQYDESYVSFGELGGENGASGISIHQLLAGSVSAGTNCALIGLNAKSKYIRIPGVSADDTQALLWTLTYANGAMKLYKNSLLAGRMDDLVLRTTTEGYLARHVWWYQGKKRTSTRLNAVLDDVRIYSRALHQTEIKRLYHSRD